MSKARLEIVLFLNRILKKASNSDILRNFKHFAYTLYGGSSSSSASSSSSSVTAPPAPSVDAATHNNNGKVNPENIQMFAGPVVKNSSSSSTAQAKDNSDSVSSSPSPVNSLSIRKISSIIHSNSQFASNTDTSQNSRVNPVARSAASSTGSSASSTANTNSYTNPSSRTYTHSTTSVTALSRMINDQFSGARPSYPSVTNVSSPTSQMQSVILSHLVRGELPSSSAPIPSHTLTDDSITSKGNSSSSIINLNSRYVNPVMLDHDPNVEDSDHRHGNPEFVKHKEEAAKNDGPTGNAEMVNPKQEPAEPEQRPNKPEVAEPLEPERPAENREVAEPKQEQPEPERPLDNREIAKPENQPETVKLTNKPNHPEIANHKNQLSERERRPGNPEEEHKHVRHGRPMVGGRTHAPRHVHRHHHGRRRGHEPNTVQAKKQHEPNRKKAKHRRHHGHKKPHRVAAPKMNGNRTPARPTVKTTPIPVKVKVASTHIKATRPPAARPIDKNKKPPSSSTGSSSGSSTSSSGSSSSSSTKPTKKKPVVHK